MSLIKWVLWLFVIARVEGLGWIQKLDDFSVSESTMKTILEACYENDSLSNPILIVGNYNKVIRKSSIVKYDNFQKLKEGSGKQQFFPFKVSRIVLVPESPEKFKADLKILKETKWWNHMAQFFIIERNKETCKNFKEILITTWEIDIINSIYICSESMNTTNLYTLNPISNYAPYPWKRMGKVKDLNIFHQLFNSSTSCTNLNYDKTKFLNGYEINVVLFDKKGGNWTRGKNYFHLAPEELPVLTVNAEILQCIIRMLNATGRLEVEIKEDLVMNYLYNGTSDLTMTIHPLDFFPNLAFLFPHHIGKIIAVIKLEPEISTLQKIFELWSVPVLIAAAISFVLLVVILTIKNHNFFLAMLDFIRLLTYTSIHADIRSHSLRIYFTTMLILIVISNGVFQGKIAAFLSKQERGRSIETIDELLRIGYQMYTPWAKEFADRNCPQCDFKVVTEEQCVKHVLHNNLHTCGMFEDAYEKRYILLPLDHVKEPVAVEPENFKCRKNWPLLDRVNEMLMRVIESGIIDFWKLRRTYVPKLKRQEMEAEWSSARYKPVKLYKLMFAFQMLVFGLSVALFVFFLEIWWAHYGTLYKSVIIKYILSRP